MVINIGACDCHIWCNKNCFATEHSSWSWLSKSKGDRPTTEAIARQRKKGAFYGGGDYDRLGGGAAVGSTWWLWVAAVLRRLYGAVAGMGLTRGFDIQKDEQQ